MTLHASSLDKPHAIYALYDRDDALLYVGCARLVARRLTAHQSQQWFWPNVARVDILATTDDRAEGLAIEKRLILDLKPRWNRTGRTPRREWSADDYMDMILDCLASHSNRPAQHRLGKRAHIWIAEVNGRFGLDLSTDPQVLTRQVARGERVVAFGRVLHEPATQERSAA